MLIKTDIDLVICLTNTHLVCLDLSELSTREYNLQCCQAFFPVLGIYILTLITCITFYHMTLIPKTSL